MSMFTRNRICIGGVMLLLISIVAGSVSVGTIGQFGEFLKIVAVVMFVTAMVGLAVGMIGDTSD